MQDHARRRAFLKQAAFALVGLLILVFMQGRCSSSRGNAYYLIHIKLRRIFFGQLPYSGCLTNATGR